MLESFRVTLRTLADVRDQGFTYIWANVAFVVFSLPIITLPAAFAALMYTIHQAQTNPTDVTFSTFFDFFKAHFWCALGWGCVYSLFFGVNTANLMTYASSTSLLANLRVIWLSAGLAGMLMLLLTWGVCFHMETPNLLGASHNTLVMLLHHPGFMLGLLSAVVAVMVMSMLLKPLFLVLTFSTLAALANNAVRNCLEARFVNG
ncbi:MAG: YesL family protein [Deinococcota bacterium]